MGYTLNWMAKIRFEGAQVTYLGVNISLLYMYTVAPKMLKETKAEKNITLCCYNCSLVAFQLGGVWFCPSLPPATPMMR